VFRIMTIVLAAQPLGQADWLIRLRFCVRGWNEVGSLSDVISPDEMRYELIQRIRKGIKRSQDKAAE
jgi:hypothetical protein